MNKAAERIASILGSAPVVLAFGLWTVYHAVTIQDYVTTISDTAILIGLLILRAETVQSERTEEAVKQDLRKSDEQMKLLRAMVNYSKDGWKL